MQALKSYRLEIGPQIYVVGYEMAPAGLIGLRVEFGDSLLGARYVQLTPEAWEIISNFMPKVRDHDEPLKRLRFNIKVDSNI